VTNDILFDRIGRAGVVTLNKPETLNAVTDAMLSALNAYLDVWEQDDQVERVIIRAVEGRAFSAGGDIRHLYERGLAKDYDFDFFAREYRLNARIASFPKPYLALVDGIVMGGGVGVSFHGKVIAGENIAFAMPEVGIGFFPDVGASYFLNKAPAGIAHYIGLTGQRLDQADCRTFGLVDYTCKSEDMDALLAALCEEENLEAVLTRFHHEPGHAGLSDYAALIEEAFEAGSVTAILEMLQAQASSEKHEQALRDWAQKTRDTILGKSPSSLMIAHRQISDGRGLSMNDCMRMEFRILKRILTGHDFYEGIRAAIIDKDRTPNWQPNSLDHVDKSAIDRHFNPLGDAELALS